jgi:CheY-like chemotaxis protein
MSARTAQQILFVDDDANLRLVLSDFLKFEGFTVAVANSGEEALEKLSELSPNVIILDMSMPGIGGLELLKRISDNSGKPRYPVLVLTARANMRNIFEDMHVDGFMSKPCEPQELISEIERILLQAQSS